MGENACLFPCEDAGEGCADACVGGVPMKCRGIFVGRHRVSLHVAACSLDDLGPGDLGLQIWPGTHAMAHLLLQMESRGELRGRSVLDLGCGTGFLGILACLAGAAPVVLADSEPRVLEGAALNVAANGVGAAVAVQQLAWRPGPAAPAGAAPAGTFELLLLSEVIYVAQPDCVPWELDAAEVAALLRLAGSLLAPGGTAWVTYGNREDGADLIRRTALEAGLSCADIPIEDVVPADDLAASVPLRRVKVFALTHSASSGAESLLASAPASSPQER